VPPRVSAPNQSDHAIHADRFRGCQRRSVAI
jgi:hypothetical protein